MFAPASISLLPPKPYLPTPEAWAQWRHERVLSN